MLFDPNAPAQPDSGIFGLPHSAEEARVVLVPVPWEATTSYGGGASQGPRAIFEASKQVDLFDLDVDRPYQHGIAMLPIPGDVAAWNEEGKALAARVIAQGGAGDDPELRAAVAGVNALSDRVNRRVEETVSEWLSRGKLVGVLGGDHAVPFGAFQAMARALKRPFGVLHFDAHSDTRRAYEGFTHSHASIMFNALEHVPEITRLVQVGIRDVCEEEVSYCRAQGERVCVFYDRTLQLRKMDGEPFTRLARDIVSKLPDLVWVSFDIDGLDPRYCPHTGTPVPGGLELSEAVCILRELVHAGKRIVGFDLNEVAPNLADEGDEWDGNVGARLLYKLIAFALASHGDATLFAS